MKILVVLLTVLSFSWGAFSQNGDVPPPPMPSYMKKKPQEASSVYANQKLQPESEVSQREPANSKFLRKNEPNVRTFIKTTKTPQIVQVDPDDAEEVKDEFLQDVSEEDTLASEQEPVRVNDYDEPTPAPSPAPAETVKVIKPVLAPSKTPDTESELPVPTASVPETPYDPLDSDTSSLEAPSQADKLMVVEEQLEASGQIAEDNLRNPRKPTSSAVFKPGMYKFSKDCKMYSEASSSGDESGVIKSGRKLWIDSHDNDWHKVYKKEGAVYISSDCLK